MTTRKTPLVALAVGLASVLPATERAQAQSVEIGETHLPVKIRDADGDIAVGTWDFGSPLLYIAGGQGRSATLNLRTPEGPSGLFYHAFLAQLAIGAPAQSGSVLLSDDQGVGTSIALDGLSGLVRLGNDGEDGDLILYDSTDSETFRVNGQTGTASNPLGANGLVKAWARIAADGSVLSCWRCEPGATSLQVTGDYVVDFGPLGSDVRSRPRAVVLDSHDPFAEEPAIATLGNAASASAVQVYVFSFDSSAANRGFTLTIY